MPYSSSEIFHLFKAYTSGAVPAFHPEHIPDPFLPIFGAFVEAYLADPHNIPARQSAFKPILETFTPQEMRTFDAYLYDGSIQYYADHKNIGLAQKAIIRALFEIAPATTKEIVNYNGSNYGNTHRQLQALVKKQLVRRHPHESTIHYHLSPTHFIVENPFPNSLAHIAPHTLLKQLKAELAEQPQNSQDPIHTYT